MCKGAARVEFEHLSVFRDRIFILPQRTVNVAAANMSASKRRVPIMDQSLTRILYSGFPYQLIEQLVTGNQLVVRIVSRLDRLRIVGERLFPTPDFSSTPPRAIRVY